MISLVQISRRNHRIAGTLSVRCRRCGSEGHAQKHVYDTYLRVLYVPVIPLGSETEWKCSSCKADPSSKIGVSKGLLAFLVFLLIPICGFIWYMAFTEMKGNTFKYVVGPAITICTIVLAVVCYTHDGSHTDILDLAIDDKEHERSD